MCVKLKFDEIQNYYLTQTLVFLGGVELKKIIYCLTTGINSFILRGSKTPARLKIINYSYMSVEK